MTTMITQAKLRNGDILNVGDEVSTKYHPNCIGQTFIIFEMHEYPDCESKVIVHAHLKGDPERKLSGLQKEGYEGNHPPGLDANHFKLLKTWL